jgi:predicted nucleic acid-binding protein
LTGRAVTNSTCLIGLERIERLDILSRVFDTVFAPPAVANPSVVIALRTQMDEGEAEAIALALELDNVLLILDDKKAAIEVRIFTLQ